MSTFEKYVAEAPRHRGRGFQPNMARASAKTEAPHKRRKQVIVMSWQVGANLRCSVAIFYPFFPAPKSLVEVSSPSVTLFSFWLKKESALGGDDGAIANQRRERASGITRDTCFVDSVLPAATAKAPMRFYICNTNVH